MSGVVSVYLHTGASSAASVSKLGLLANYYGHITHWCHATLAIQSHRIGPVPHLTVMRMSCNYVVNGWVQHRSHELIGHCL
jgi:hypothetical protein